MLAAPLQSSATVPGGGGSRDIDAAVRQVIGDAVDAGEVIDLFAAAGLDAARLDILSEDFLNRVSALEQKNLALETLRKLLTDQIKISERTNLVQAQKFREALEKAMLGYTNKQITTAEMIAKLLELAKWVREAKQHGQDLGLSTEEVAFYDALAENGSAKDVMQSDQLRLMARELAEMVKKMRSLDELKLADNTVVFFTSDNGPEGDGIKSPGRGRKRAAYEGGIRVPGIVRWPGKAQLGTTSDEPVIGSDIFVTAVGIAGAKLRTDRIQDGGNLLAAIEGRVTHPSSPFKRKTKGADA